MADTLTQEEQVALAERLQSKWLTHMEKLLDAGTITSTDMATLARVLMSNGWVIDPSKLPQKLRDKLTDSIPDVADFEAMPQLRAI